LHGSCATIVLFNVATSLLELPCAKPVILYSPALGNANAKEVAFAVLVVNVFVYVPPFVCVIVREYPPVALLSAPQLTVTASPTA